MLNSPAVPHPQIAPPRGLRPLAGLLLTLTACGGGSPTSPPLPTPPPPPAGSSVSVVVFYDENGDGQLGPEERIRVPGVVVEISGRTGTSEIATGQASVTGVPDGTHGVSVRTESLPPFWAAGTAPSVTTPTSSAVPVPLTLPIGTNRRNVYLAFGDSITDGDGSSDQAGYRNRLRDKLEAHQGGGITIVNDGIGGTTSRQGSLRLPNSLNRNRPAYTLILYGTNDWNESECNADIAPCYTGTMIGRMINEAKLHDSLPFVATITPANTGFDDRAPAERNIRIDQQNQQIKAEVAAQGAVLVDLYAALMNAGPLNTLFVDHVHPSDRGYDVISDEWFRAITRARAAASSGAGFRFLDLDAAAGLPGFHGAGPRHGELDASRRLRQLR